MKSIYLIALTIMFFLISCINDTKAQTNPVLLIDNDSIAFNAGVSLPYWLKAGQKITLSNNVKSVSILEFSIDTSSNLKFSQALSLSSSTSGVQTVPNGKVWKIEAFGLTMASTKAINNSGGSTNTGNSLVIDTTSITNSFVASANTKKPTIFTSPATFGGSGNWIVPPGVTQICVEIWGAGGDGASSPGTQNSGGGGGYGYQCFTVKPMNNYTITVGGGSGATSSIVETASGDTLIWASGGTNGKDVAPGASSPGGTSSATYRIDGGVGGYRNGGSGGNGAGVSLTGGSGYFPGGGGGGYGYTSTIMTNGGLGASGQVIIYW